MDWIGVDYIVMFLSDSHSDGTHSLQSIRCWASDAMLHFSKSDEETNLNSLRVRTFSANFHFCFGWNFPLKKETSNVTLEHKTSLKSLGYICSQQYIVWVKIMDFSFMPKIIRILRSCSVKIFCKFSTVNISKLNFWLLICIAKNFIWTTLKSIFSIFRFFCILRFQIFK